MNDLIRSSIYTGLGSLVLAQQKFEELVEELIQNNELTQDEGQRIVQEMIHKAEDFRNEAEDRFLNAIDELLFIAKLPGRNELEVKINDWLDQIRNMKSLSVFKKEKTDKPVAQ